MVDRLAGFEATRNQEPAHNFERQPNGGGKERDRYIRFDYARRSDFADDGRDISIAVVRIVQGFATPISEKVANPDFIDARRWEETERNLPRAVGLTRLVFGFELRRNFGRKASARGDGINPAGQHFCIR